MNIKMLFFLLAILMTSSSAQEEIIEEQIALNGYVDYSGKVLITGYASSESLSYLTFLNLTQYTYDNDTNQLYAVTDMLTEKSSGIWHFNFSSRGYYSDYLITFFLPPGSDIIRFELSPGLNYQLQVMNDSLVMAVRGYRIASPEIEIDYKQPIDVTEKIESESNSSLNLTILFAIVLIGAAVILFIVKMKKPHFPQKKELPGTKPEIEPVAEPKKKEITITSEMKKVIDTLSDNEKAIINLLLGKGGSLTQAEIRYETGMPKSSLSGIINALRRKNLVKKREYGKTNVIELTPWFLSEKEVQ
jgi:DNA-binding transcriptional ArsR family regulator